MRNNILIQCPAIQYNSGHAQAIINCFFRCYSIPINEQYKTKLGHLSCQDVKCEDCYVKQLYERAMKNEN